MVTIAMFARRGLLATLTLLLAALLWAASGPALAQNIVNTADGAENGSVTANESNVQQTTTTTNGSETTDRTRNPGPGDNVQNPGDGVYSAMFKILFQVFIIAVILESALAIIFNWRPFLLYFDGRGVKTLISVAVAWAVAGLLGLDVIAQLDRAAGGTGARLGVIGMFISALILAGGSAGVNNILRSLGFRQLGRREDVAPKPPKDHAWLAVRLKRREAAGPVRVMLQRDREEEELVGMIWGSRSPAGFLRWFLQDPTRYPTVAGHMIEGGTLYWVHLEAETEENRTIRKSWGPYRIAKGAIIDLELEV